MMTEVEKKNRKGLLKLMQENPGLPVIPLVEGGSICDDYAYMLYELGDAHIDEYILDSIEGRMLYKADYNIMRVLEECLSPEEFENLPDSESECKAIYDSLPWKKAIILYINVPGIPEILEIGIQWE